MTTISLSNQVDYVFKKILGAPDTAPTTASTPATYITEANYFSKPNSFLSQIYAQPIPIITPSDFTITIGGGIAASASYPYIYSYTNLQLSQVSGQTLSFVNSALIGLISPKFSPTYGYTITGSTGTPISADSTYKSALVIDPDSGILTFFTLPSFVSSTYLPLVSFYRYVGLTGNPGISQVDNY